MKQSFVAGLYLVGQAASNYAAAGYRSRRGPGAWYASINAGEPYDQNPLSQDIVDEITKHHSSYYIDHSIAPAPLLISNGFTDDLFPPDEAIRFYNRTRSQYQTPVSLIFTDHGHQRGQNKTPDATFLSREQHKWFDFYVKGQGTTPYQGVQTLTQVCGGPSGGATGAYRRPEHGPAVQGADGGRTSLPARCASASAASKVIASAVTDTAGAGVRPDWRERRMRDRVRYRSDRRRELPAGRRAVGRLHADGLADDRRRHQLTRPDLPGRGPPPGRRPRSGNETLVARGLYRPEINSGTAATRQVFQLHPNGWKFDTGHIAKLELLPADQPYGRNSNGQLPVTVSNLELRLPVLEQPGAQAGLVADPAPKVVPPGYQLSGDYVEPGYPRPKGATPFRVPLVPAYAQCAGGNRQHGPPLSFASCNPPQQTSGQLTVGTNDANGEAANSVGAVRFDVVVGNPATQQSEADVLMSVSITDVRRKADLLDYAGQLQLNTALRITDRNNGASETEAGTFETTLPLTVPCVATGSATTGGTCSLSSSFNAIVPGGVVERDRAIWQLGQIEVFDGGADGLASTSPNTVFARQGIFVP